MPDDRKCGDNDAEQSADDVQRSVDANVLRLGRPGYNSWTVTLALCRADIGESTCPTCNRLAQGCPASVTPGASDARVRGRTSWCH